jgi:hypothetical protein
MGKQENSQIVETAKEARGAELGPTVRNVLVWSLKSRGGGVCRHLFHVFPELSLLGIQHAKGKVDLFR